MNDESQIPKSEYPAYSELYDAKEDFYSLPRPLADSKPPTVHPSESTLSIRSASATGHSNRGVELYGIFDDTPSFEHSTNSQQEEYLEQSAKANIQRLQRNLTECTERQDSAIEFANVALGKLMSFMEKDMVLDRDTNAQLKVMVEDFEEEFKDWNLSVMKDQTSEFRIFMDTTHTAIKKLSEALEAATESFESYVEVWVKKEKWEKKIETPKLVAAAFGDN